MLQRNQIVLTIPTIDLSLLKRIKGGYSPDGHDNDNIYSQDNYDPENDSYGLGELEPSVCKPNEPLDEFEYENPEFNEQDEPDDYQNEDSRAGGLNDYNEGDQPNIIQVGSFTLVNFSQENVQFIINAINNLPQQYHGLAVRIECKTTDAGSGNFTPGTIVIGLNADNQANIGSLHEELNHALQYLRYGEDMLSMSRSAIEFQAKMLEDLVQQQFRLPFDDFTEMFGQSNSDFWFKCYNADNSFNREYFIEHAADLYDEFVDYYNKIGNPGNYGSQYDPNFNWDWDYWLDLFGI